ncbi:MAG: L,D-transpeptidase [Candidatus Hydrogenedentes bacterium]|nr:L,D-transpeptidase [Candidatus Hydrogenedentota bacterium]
MVRVANPSGGERRAANRAATNRTAVVISADAATPLFTGTAFDISRDGVGIRTYSTLPKGAAVEIEMAPRPDRESESLIRVSGHVARCEPAGSHEFALGIQYRVHTPFTARPETHRIRTVRRAPVPDLPQPHPGRRGSRLAPWLAVLAAILLFLLWWPMDESGATTPHQSNPRLAKEDRLPAPETLPPSAGEGDPLTTSRETIPTTLARVGLAWDDGSGGGRPGLAELDELTGKGGPGEFVDFDETPEGGDPGGATRIGSALGARTTGLGDGEIGFAFTASTANGGGGARDAVASGGSSNETKHVPRREGSSVHLEVDRETFEMTVYVDGRRLWKFPVGLGKDGSTPSGEFTVHNKIAQPDWFHRGETVPYGHPRNPLGESWMGLASDGSALSYGIHPTNEPESIGTANGAGCIRMRPADAEKLFRFCPIGATVRIASSR